MLSTALTFNAVASAIANAGGRTILVECTVTMVVSLGDLEIWVLSYEWSCAVWITGSAAIQQ